MGLPRYLAGTVSGGPLHDPEADAVLVRTLAERLDPRVPLRRLDLHINDPAFADACADTLLAMLSAGLRSKD